MVYGYPPKVAVDPNSLVHMPWLPQTSGPAPPLPPNEPSGTDLFRSVESGDLTMVHYFVSKAGISANYTDPVGNTTLHVAARKGHSQICNYLIEQGVEPNVTNERGHTPIMWAVTNGHLNCVATLAKKGADPGIKDAKGYNSLMHAAVSGHLFILHYLIAVSKLDVNSTDVDGHTPIIWAATNGHAHVVDYLLGPHCPLPVHIGIIDSSGRTAMHWAAHNDHLKCVELLAKATCKACAHEEREDCKAKQGEHLFAIQDIEGMTPAKSAKAKGHRSLESRMEHRLWGEEKTPKGEPALQFLSTFLPHFVLFFVVIPDFPFWVGLICTVVIFWVHSNVRWSKPEKTLIPAGLMAGGVLLLTKIYFECLSFAVFLFIESLMLYGVSHFYRLMTEDPGIIHPDENDYAAALNAVEFGVEPQEFCRFCKVRKPPRAKHCRVCNTCTNRFDHHCFWIYNCVAEKNIWLFYVFLLEVLLHISLFELVTFRCIYTTSFLDTIGEAFFLHPQKAWAMIFCAIVFVPVFSLFSYHSSFISRDVTTYELMRPRKGMRPKKMSGKRLITFLKYGSQIFEKGEGEGAV